MTTAKQNQKFPCIFLAPPPPTPPPRSGKRNGREIFGFCTRESASVSEAHCIASPRNRSVRGSFKPPRAPRVRSGFAQRLIHHRRKKLPNPKGGIQNLQFQYTLWLQSRKFDFRLTRSSNPTRPAPSRARLRKMARTYFAETVGFEPTRVFLPCLVSSEVLSATQSRLRYSRVSY